MRYALFFPLDSQVACIFCPETCLTTFRVVTCVTHGWILIQIEASQPTTFLNMVADQERFYPDIISPVRSGKYVWAWLVNEGNWACRLGYYVVGFSHSGPVGRRVWAKAHGTHIGYHSFCKLIVIHVFFLIIFPFNDQREFKEIVIIVSLKTLSVKPSETKYE